MDRTHLRELVGAWSGTNKLWMMPGTPAEESDTTASIALESGGQCASVRYTWQGGEREGVMLVRLASTDSTADIVWTDSWHMQNEFLVLRAEPDSESLVSARGSYAAPPGPDWGWRIALRSDGPESFTLLMFNATPDGQEAPAVEAMYTRAR